MSNSGSSATVAIANQSTFRNIRLALAVGVPDGMRELFHLLVHPRAFGLEWVNQAH